MALLTNSYGDTGEVAALVPRQAAIAKAFDPTTNPTLLRVESFCDQVSALLNSILAENGFDIPVTNADVKLMLDMFVNEEVASIIEGVNGSGRFGPTTKRTGPKGRFALVLEDVEAFVMGNAVGIERLGATRSNDPIAGISFRGQDEGGNDTAPIFQRSAFGDSFRDWDK